MDILHASEEAVWSYVNAEDYAVTDSSFYDPEFPPEHFPMHFVSGGEPVHGWMWLAQGEGAKGCAIFIPQLFGGDNLESLITPLVGAGIHVMKFHPRGMWDGGQYSFAKTIEDVHAAVAFLRQNSGEHHTIEGRRYQINTERIAIIGKSGGGGQVGMAAAAENAHLNSAVAVIPSNGEMARGIQGSMEERSEEQTGLSDMLSRVKEATAGRVDVHALLASTTPEEFDRMSLIKQAPKLVTKNLLLVGASADQQAPLRSNHRPIAEALRRAGAENFTDVILEGDGYLLTARIALARLVIRWLREACDF